MKSHKYILALAGMAVLVSGCVNPDGSPNNTGTGALVGGTFGALTGAAIGGRHGGPDALIGAAAGALAGGLIGNVADQQQAALQEQAPVVYVQPYQSAPMAYAPAAPAPPVTDVHAAQAAPLTIENVKALVKAGVAEDMIISQIAGSHTVFHLSASDIIGLRDAGVSDKVVNFMINTPSTVGAAPAPAPEAVMYSQEPPPPPVTDTMVASPGAGYVWVAGEWILNNGGWVWVGGHWATPPNPHTVWIGGRSWYDGQGWHNEPGHWQ